MKLDLANLTAFAAVLSEGSFDAAAKRLHVTPSAVSQRVKSLESQIGQVLIQRTRPARPTEAGQVLVRLAGQIALFEGEALAALGSSGDQAEPSVRLSVAVNADSLATWFLPVLTHLPEHLVTTFDIRHEDQDHSAELLRNGTVMAAVTADARAVQGCSVEGLGAMRYLAVASPGYVRRYLAAGPTPEAMSEAPTLAFDRKDHLQERFTRMLVGRQLDAPTTYLPSSWGFIEAARLGLAWGMAPQEMAQPELDAGNLVEIAPQLHLDIPLYWQRWRLDSPLLAALTDAVRTAAAASLT